MAAWEVVASIGCLEKEAGDEKKLSQAPEQVKPVVADNLTTL
jgi:hypothetical protein